MQYYIYPTELQHHGIKGQRWGVRRFQLEDGSLTPAGAKRQLRLEHYREREQGRLSKRYNVERATRKVDKALSKYNANKNDKTKEAARKALIEKYKIETLKKLESKRISQMSYDDMKKEKKALIGNAVNIADRLVQTGAIAATGFAIGKMASSNTNDSTSEQTMKKPSFPKKPGTVPDFSEGTKRKIQSRTDRQGSEGSGHDMKDMAAKIKARAEAKEAEAKANRAAIDFHRKEKSKTEIAIGAAKEIGGAVSATDAAYRKVKSNVKLVTGAVKDVGTIGTAIATKNAGNVMRAVVSSNTVKYAKTKAVNKAISKMALLGPVGGMAAASIRVGTDIVNGQYKSNATVKSNMRISSYERKDAETKALKKANKLLK